MKKESQTFDFHGVCNRVILLKLLQARKFNMYMQAPQIVISNPDILGGTPVFAGTRVPFRIMFEYLETGDSLDVFLDEFPSVSRALAIAGLEHARLSASHAHPA